MGQGHRGQGRRHDPRELRCAKQSYHAQLGAYAYGKDKDTDFVACFNTDTRGNRVLWELWDGRPEPEPEPEPDVEVVNE